MSPLLDRAHVRALQIPSQTWDGAVPQTDSQEIFCGLLKKAKLLFWRVLWRAFPSWHKHCSNGVKQTERKYEADLSNFWQEQQVPAD
jgi:hypothetical protein